MNINPRWTISLIAFALPVLAAQDAWVGKIVKANYAGQQVPGRIIHSMGCLYVKFDRPQAGGIVMARIADSIEGLQVQRGQQWVPLNLQIVTKGERADCFAEANG